MHRVLITRPRLQSDIFAENLRRAGFEPIYFPVIEIHPIPENKPLQAALSQLHSFDWVVFTSANGVEAVFNTLQEMDLAGIPAQVKVAAIGPKTAEALQAHQVVPALVPDEYVAEAIVPGMGNLAGKRVLLPGAEIARKALAEAIAKAGGLVQAVAVYQTLPASPDEEGLQALRTGVDVVTLTSSSTVQNFVALARQAGLDPLCLPGNPAYACIGPITEQTAREEGLPKRIIADEYTTDGLIAAIQALLKR
jgi:uroporphyrinogen-III synthase